VRAVGGRITAHQSGPLWGVGVDGFILFVDDRIGLENIQIFTPIIP
jgi:hypothetical protein